MMLNSSDRAITYSKCLRILGQKMLNYSYTKKRTELGVWCRFKDRGPYLTMDVHREDDPTLSNQYVVRRCSDESVQVAAELAVAEVGQQKQAMESRGMLHVEGGWPKEVNYGDEEQVERYRRRAQKDALYVNVMGRLTTLMETQLLLNNSLDVYKMTNHQPDIPRLRRVFPEMKIISDFRAPVPNPVPVRNISWNPSHLSEFLVTLEYHEAFCWSLDNFNQPITSITSPVPMEYLLWFPKENKFGGGLANGQMAIWDYRKQCHPISLSAPELSHRGPVTCFQWLSSKKGTEMFSVSLDGYIKWWDAEKMKKPTNEIFVGTPILFLEYYSVTPTRYTYGTSDGYVMAGNLRGNTLQEKQIWKQKVSDGPIIGIQHHPAFTKIFFVIVQQSVEIWSEDCKEHPIIILSSSPFDVTAAKWSPTKFTLLVIAREDGMLLAFDLLENHAKPIFSLRLHDCTITSISFRDDGKLLAVGNNIGYVYMVSLTNDLVYITGKERAELTLLFDAEVAKEKVVEGKSKEIALIVKKAKEKEKMKAVVKEKGTHDDVTAVYLEEVKKGLGLIPDVPDEVSEDQEEG